MQKEMKTIFLRCYILGAAMLILHGGSLSAQAAATASKPVDWENVPPALRDAFSKKPLDGKYDVSTHINPFYLRGDFDGDGIADYAVLVTEVVSHKQGILVWLSSVRNFVFLGAGTPIQYGAKPEDDLDFDEWRILGPNPADKTSSLELPPNLRHDAIFVEKSESASGVFYWSRGRFRWFQEGD
jgi:hypothetical protein